MNELGPCNTLGLRPVVKLLLPSRFWVSIRMHNESKNLKFAPPMEELGGYIPNPPNTPLLHVISCDNKNLRREVPR